MFHISLHISFYIRYVSKNTFSSTVECSICVYLIVRVYLVGGTHCGFVRNVVGPAQLLDGLRWHGLGKTQTTPRVSWCPYLSHNRLLQHSWTQDTDKTSVTRKVWKKLIQYPLRLDRNCPKDWHLPLVANSFFCSYSSAWNGEEGQCQFSYLSNSLEPSADVWARVCEREKWSWNTSSCTCMLAKEECGAKRILSLSFCCAALSAALSAARSLPGALLSVTGLSEALDSGSDSKQSELWEGHKREEQLY